MLVKPSVDAPQEINLVSALENFVSLTGIHDKLGCDSARTEGSVEFTTLARRDPRVLRSRNDQRRGLDQFDVANRRVLPMGIRILVERAKIPIKCSASIRRSL